MRLFLRQQQQQRRLLVCGGEDNCKAPVVVFEWQNNVVLVLVLRGGVAWGIALGRLGSNRRASQQQCTEARAPPTVTETAEEFLQVFQCYRCHLF